MTLLEYVVKVIGSEPLAAFRDQYGLRGYLVVGSAALLPPDSGTDVDVVLPASTVESSPVHDVPISDRPTEEEPTTLTRPVAGPPRAWVVTVLRALCRLLTRELELKQCEIWCVQATVCVMKIQWRGESIDMLWLFGCEVNDKTFRGFHPEPRPGDGVRLQPGDTDLCLPRLGGRVADSVHLSRLFQRQLPTGARATHASGPS